MRRSTRVALGTALAIAALAGSGAGIGYVVAELDTDPPPALAATPRANEVECVNIDRAYHAWSSSRLRSADEFATINEGDMRDELDDQKALLEAVQGYANQSSKVLATTVAEFGVELTMLNVKRTIRTATGAQAVKVAAAHEKVREQYIEWKTATCPV